MSAVEAGSGDRAGRCYWDRRYAHGSRGVTFDPRSWQVRSFWKRGLHRYLAGVFGGMGPGRSLVEVGSGGSRMLPYFAREFGYQVTGIDYSAPGCGTARANLAEEGVSGTVICADLFSPPTALLQKFDIVVSFGVVEHFSNTVRCLQALGRLLKPGGLIVTTVPNMAGLVGSCQRVLDREVFDKHVPLDRDMLSKAHTEAGFRVTRCEYLLFANFAVVNINGTRAGTVGYWARLAALHALRGVTAASWALETAFRPGWPNRFTSPYIACAATCEQPVGPGAKA